VVIKAVHDLHPKHFQWRKPPYEYEKKKMPIDILAGTNKLRKDIEKGESVYRIEEWWKQQSHKFQKKVRSRYLMYK
jgi:uncharacterized protein YbbC (DUF1343 family)